MATKTRPTGQRSPVSTIAVDCPSSTQRWSGVRRSRRRPAAPRQVRAAITLRCSSVIFLTASAEKPADGQTAAKAVDGCVDDCPGDHTAEWAAPNGGVATWLRAPIRLSAPALGEIR
ncbi:DUF7402 domain-containing protein [Modestobacter marinus]|uniref:DUF7402 domain-containing protein n=1 Tax=Modestobacter marinus TaxID=477641 RepID=UPI001C93AE1A|nr:hypothetical protein [Modestobacter marinus]